MSLDKTDSTEQNTFPEYNQCNKQEMSHDKTMQQGLISLDKTNATGTRNIPWQNPATGVKKIPWQARPKQQKQEMSHDKTMQQEQSNIPWQVKPMQQEQEKPLDKNNATGTKNVPQHDQYKRNERINVHDPWQNQRSGNKLCPILQPAQKEREMSLSTINPWQNHAMEEKHAMRTGCDTDMHAACTMHHVKRVHVQPNEAWNNPQL